MVIYKVHFINDAGYDVYIEVVDWENAQSLVEELRLLKLPAEVLQYGTIPE